MLSCGRKRNPELTTVTLSTSAFVLLKFPSLEKKGGGDRNFPTGCVYSNVYFPFFFSLQIFGNGEHISSLTLSLPWQSLQYKPKLFRMPTTNRDKPFKSQKFNCRGANSLSNSCRKVLAYSEYGGDFCYSEGESNPYKVLLFDKYIR